MYTLAARNSSAMSMLPPPTAIEFLARAMIVVSGRMLVCRDRRHGHCYLPGGHVEPGESASEATERELQEEMGLSVEVGLPLLAWEARFTQRGKPRHEFTLVFHVEPRAPLADAEAPASLESHLAFEFVAPVDILMADLRPRLVAAWFANHGVPSGDRMHWLSIDERG